MTKLIFILSIFLLASCTDVPETVSDKYEAEAEAAEDLPPTPPPLDTIKTPPTDTVKYTVNADGYIELTWAHLAEVDFEERYTEEVDTYVPYPVFRPSVQRLAGEKVRISGYVIPVEETGEESIIVLSANPFSSCFFCGMAGPETIMDIKLQNKFKNKFKQDQTVTFRGKLRLNDSDLYYLNYILEEAEVVAR